MPAEILKAAGDITGGRAGLQIQHDSDVMVTHLDLTLAVKGVIFTDPTQLRAEYLTSSSARLQ